MSTSHDRMLEALSDMRTAAKAMRESNTAYHKAVNDYATAQARFEEASAGTPVRPLITEDLPVIPIAQRAATAIEDLG